MEHIREKLLKETIRFVDLCQKLTLSGKISIDNYYLMTNIKFQFIDNILKDEKDDFFIDKATQLCLNKLLKKDSYIHGINKDVVGN